MQETKAHIHSERNLTAYLDGHDVTEALAETTKMVDELGEEALSEISLVKQYCYPVGGGEPTLRWEIMAKSSFCPDHSHD